MSGWVHRLANIDEEARTAECRECGPVKIKRTTDRGKVRYRCRTPVAEYARDAYARSGISRPHRRYMVDFCESCGLVPTHKAMLEADHIDGNRRNHHVSNVQTLCANCHNVKTYDPNTFWRGLHVRELSA